MAFATRIRSPYICERSLRYGVSPHPAQAPLASNRGSSICEPLIEATFTSRRSAGGMSRKKSRFARSAPRCSTFGIMSIALCLTTSFDFAGQTSTHTPHPVQSSGTTWIVIHLPGFSRSRHSLCWNVAGAWSAAIGSYTFMRIAVCGQTSAHLAQSMQMSGSQIGISCAIERFSHFAVSVGKVPSTGSAETGSRSPLPASIIAVTRWTKSGASSGTGGGRCRSPATPAGTGTSCMPSSAASTAAKFCSTTERPRLP